MAYLTKDGLGDLGFSFSSIVKGAVNWATGAWVVGKDVTKNPNIAALLLAPVLGPAGVLVGTAAVGAEIAKQIAPYAPGVATTIVAFDLPYLVGTGQVNVSDVPQILLTAAPNIASLALAALTGGVALTVAAVSTVATDVTTTYIMKKGLQAQKAATYTNKDIANLLKGEKVEVQYQFLAQMPAADVKNIIAAMPADEQQALADYSLKMKQLSAGVGLSDSQKQFIVGALAVIAGSALFTHFLKSRKKR